MPSSSSASASTFASVSHPNDTTSMCVSRVCMPASGSCTWARACSYVCTMPGPAASNSMTTLMSSPNGTGVVACAPVRAALAVDLEPERGPGPTPGRAPDCSANPRLLTTDAARDSTTPRTHNMTCARARSPPKHPRAEWG